MTGDLVAWLREQIAERRRTVELSGPGVLGWGTYRHEDGSMKYTSPVARNGDVWVTAGKETQPNSVLVVFDPAAVLAQCDAHEAILREHRPYGEWLRDELPDWAPSEERSCVGCGFDNQEERQTLDVNNCPTLRALALAYQHRDGFREEWRRPPGD